MPESTNNPTDPNTLPDPLLTEPEFIQPLDSSPVPEVPRGRRAAATFIFFTVTLDMLALGMISPVLPRLIARFMHGNDVSAAQMLGLFGTVFAVMQFFCSPIIGSLSDRFGLRSALSLPSAMLGVAGAFCFWCMKHYDKDARHA